MPQFTYSIGETLAFDAGEFGQAIVEVTGYTDIPAVEDGTSDALEVRVLESNHPKLDRGGSHVLPAHNENLSVIPDGADPSDVFDTLFDEQ